MKNKVIKTEINDNDNNVIEIEKLNKNQLMERTMKDNYDRNY